MAKSFRDRINIGLDTIKDIRVPSREEIDDTLELAADIGGKFDDFRSNLTDFVNESIASPLGGAVRTIVGGKEGSIADQALDFAGSVVGSTLDTLGDVASDIISLEPIRATVDIADYSSSGQAAIDAEERGITKFEASAGRFIEDNSEGIEDFANAATLFVGGAVAKPLSKLANPLLSKLPSVIQPVVGAIGSTARKVAPAILGESSTVPGLVGAIGAGAIGFLNDPLQEGIGNAYNDSIYDALGVDDLGKDYASRLVKFTDSIDQKDITSEDVEAYNSSGLGAIEVSSIQDLKDVVKGVNKGLSFGGRLLSNAAGSSSSLAGSLFMGAGISSDVEISTEDVVEDEIDEGSLIASTGLGFGSSSLDRSVVSFGDYVIASQEKISDQISGNIGTIQEKFKINEDQFIQTTISRYEGVIEDFDISKNAVSVTEDLLNAEKDPSKKEKIRVTLNEQLVELEKYKKRIDAIEDLNSREISAEVVGGKVDTKAAAKEGKKNADLGSSDPFDQIKKLQFQADRLASDDNAVKVGSNMLGNIANFLGTAGTEAAIFLDLAGEYVGKDSYSTFLKYGIEGTTSEPGVFRSLGSEIVDQSDKIIPAVGTFFAQRLLKLPGFVKKSKPMVSANDYIKNSSFWRKNITDGGVVNNAIVKGGLGAVGEIGEELAQLASEGALEALPIQGGDVFYASVVAGTVGSITNAAGVVDSYIHRSQSNTDSLIEYINKNESWDDVTVVQLGNQSRQATIDGVKSMITSVGSQGSEGETFLKKSVAMSFMDAGASAISLKTNEVGGNLFQSTQANGNRATNTNGETFKVYEDSTREALSAGAIDSSLQIEYTPEALSFIAGQVEPTIKEFQKSITEISKIAYNPSNSFSYDKASDSFVQTGSSSQGSDFESFIDLVRERSEGVVSVNGQKVNSSGTRSTIGELLSIQGGMTQGQIFSQIRNLPGKNTSTLYARLLSVNNSWLWQDSQVDGVDENGKAVQINVKVLSPQGLELISKKGLVGSEFEAAIASDAARKAAEDMSDYFNAIRNKESTIDESQSKPKEIGTTIDENGQEIKIEPNLAVSLDIKSGSNEIRVLNPDGSTRLLDSDVSSILLERWNAKNRWNVNFNEDGQYIGDEYTRKTIDGATVLVGKPDKRYAHPDIYYNLLKGSYPGLVESVAFREIPQGKELEISEDGVVTENSVNEYASLVYLDEGDMDVLGINKGSFRRINLLLNRYFNFGSSEFKDFDKSQQKFEYAKEQLKKYEDKNTNTFRVPTGRRSKTKIKNPNSSLWASSFLSQYDPIVQGGRSEDRKKVWSRVDQSFLQKLLSEFSSDEAMVGQFLTNLLTVKEGEKFDFARANRLVDIMSSDVSKKTKEMYMSPQSYPKLGETKDGVKKIPLSVLLLGGEAGDSAISLTEEFGASVYKTLSRYLVTGDVGDAMLDRSQDRFHALVAEKARQIIDSGLFNSDGSFNEGYSYSEYYKNNKKSLDTAAKKQAVDFALDRNAEIAGSGYGVYMFMNSIGLSISQTKIPNFRAHLQNILAEGGKVSSVSDIESAYESFLGSTLGSGTVLQRVKAKKKVKVQFIDSQIEGNVKRKKDGSIDVMANIVTYLNDGVVDIQGVSSILSLSVSLNQISIDEANEILSDLRRLDELVLYSAEADALLDANEALEKATSVVKKMFNSRTKKDLTNLESYSEEVQKSLFGAASLGGIGGDAITDNDLLLESIQYLSVKKDIEDEIKQLEGKYKGNSGKVLLNDDLFLSVFPVAEFKIKTNVKKSRLVPISKDEVIQKVSKLTKTGKGTPRFEGILPIGEYSNFMIGLGFSPLTTSENWNGFVAKMGKIGFSQAGVKKMRERYAEIAKGLKSSGVEGRHSYTKADISYILGTIPDSSKFKKKVVDSVEKEVSIEVAEFLKNQGEDVDIESQVEGIDFNPKSSIGKDIAISFIEKTTDIDKLKDIDAITEDIDIKGQIRFRLNELIEGDVITLGEAEGLFPDFSDVEADVYASVVDDSVGGALEVENEILEIKKVRSPLVNVAGILRQRVPKFDSIHKSFLDYFSNRVSPSLNKVNSKYRSIKKEAGKREYLARIEAIRSGADPLAEEAYIVEFLSGLSGIREGVGGNTALNARLLKGINQEIKGPDLFSLLAISRGGLLSFLKFYNKVEYQNILPVDGDISGFVNMFGDVKDGVGSIGLSKTEVKTLFDAYGREKLTASNMIESFLDKYASTRFGKAARLFVPAKSTIGQIGKSLMFISYVVPTITLQLGNPLVAIFQQILPTFMQYWNNVNFGHRSNAKSGGMNIVNKINEDLGIFPETFVSSPETGFLEKVFTLGGSAPEAILKAIDRFSPALNTGPQQMLDIFMNDAFNRIAIQATLDKYGSREEALSRIYNPDGTINKTARDSFVDEVARYKENTLFKFDNGYDTYHSGGRFTSMLMLNGGWGFSHSRILFNNLTNGYFDKTRAIALEKGLDPNGVSGSHYEVIRAWQNVFQTMLYAYRLQRLFDNNEDEEDDDETKVRKILEVGKYLFQGSQAFQSSGFNRVALKAMESTFQGIRKTFNAHMMHGNEEKLLTDPEGYAGMIGFFDTLLTEAGRSFFFSDQAADMTKSLLDGENPLDVFQGILDNLQYKSLGLMRFFTDEVENDFGLISPQSDESYVNALLGKKSATDLYRQIQKNVSYKDLTDSEGTLDPKATWNWVLKKLPHVLRLPTDSYRGVYLGSDKDYVKAINDLKGNEEFYRSLSEGDTSVLNKEERIKYTRDILYKYVSNPYTNLLDGSEGNDENVSQGTILFDKEFKALLGEKEYEAYQSTLLGKKFVSKADQVTRFDILNKSFAAAMAGEEGGDVPAGTTQHLLTLTAQYLRDEASKNFINPSTGKAFKKYSGSEDNPYRDTIDDFVGSELLPYLEMANKNDYIDMVSEVSGGRSEIFATLLDANGNFKSEKLRRVFWADMASSIAVSQGNISGSQMYNIYNQISARPKAGDTEKEKTANKEEADLFNVSMAIDVFENIDESVLPMQDKVDIILPIVGNNEDLFAKAINDKNFQDAIGEDRLQYMKNFLYGVSKDIDHLPKAMSNLAGLDGGLSSTTKRSKTVRAPAVSVPAERSPAKLKFQKFTSKNIKFDDLKATGYKPQKRNHSARRTAVYKSSTGRVKSTRIASLRDTLKSRKSVNYKPKSSKSNLKRILKILGGE